MPIEGEALELPASSSAILTWPPAVLAIAIAEDDDESWVAISEEVAGEGNRISLHRVPHSAHPPDLSVPWATLPLATERAPSFVRVSPIGDGVAVYCRDCLADSGGGSDGLFRLDASGQLSGSDAVIPFEAGNCGLTPAGDAVVVACSAPEITLRLCPLDGPCAGPTTLDSAAVAGAPPAVVVDDEALQVLYEMDGPRLRRTWVGRSSLSVLRDEELLDLTPSDDLARVVRTEPVAARVQEGVLVAYGDPTIIGVWNDAGELLQSYVAQPFDADAVTESKVFQPWVVSDDAAYSAECRSWSRLEYREDSCHLMRVPLDSLEPESPLSSTLPMVGALFAPPAPLAALYDTGLSLRYLPLDAGTSLEADGIEVRAGRRELQPLRLFCRGGSCNLLLSDNSTYRIGPGGEPVSGPVALEVPESADCLLGMETGFVFGTPGPDEPALVTADAVTGSSVVTALPMPASVAFPEGGGYRVFMSSAPEDGYVQGLVTDGALGETSPVSSGAPYAIRRCGERYVALSIADSGQYLATFDPTTDGDFVLGAQLDVAAEHWDCVGSAALTMSGVAQATDRDTMSVMTLAGCGVATLPMPSQRWLAAVRAVEETGRFYSLWGSTSDPASFELLVVDSDGRATSHALELPSAPRRDVLVFASQPFDVDGDDVSMAWMRVDETVMVSTWTLP